MKKKIIIFMPSIEGGGVEKNLFIISNYLNQYYQLYLITTSKNHLKKFKKIKFIIPKINLVNNKGRLIKYFFSIIELIKAIFYIRPNLILSFQANIYSIIVSKIFRKKIIVRSNSSPSGWGQNFLKRFLFKKILNFADDIIVNSFDFKKEMQKKFKIHTTCIYNPLNKSEIIRKSKKKIKFNFFKKKYLNIICIGRLVDQKNFLIILKALNLIKNQIKFKLLIMGSGYERQKLINFVQDNKLNNEVKILNFNNNPYPYLNISDLFILTSTFEGLPNVLLEAMVLKKFIISSDCPTGPKEILKNGEFGFLFPINDYKELSNQIIRYFKNKKNLKAKTSLAFKSLIRFDSNKNLLKYKNLIEKNLN